MYLIVAHDLVSYLGNAMTLLMGLGIENKRLMRNIKHGLLEDSVALENIIFFKNTNINCL